MGGHAISSLILCFHLFVFASTFEVYQQRVVINATELCVIPITPELFKWEKQSGYVNQIEYMARISNSPDLPGWLQYSYDKYSSIGYLYGVPPVHLISLNLDVIAWNKFEGYDVRKLIISLEIMRKDTLDYVMELKIDNLNVKDLCIPKRMNDLINIMSDQLSWVKHNGDPVVPVFLASAVALGENRVPVRPNDAEGVVVHLASDKYFSPELKKLQMEVLPLWKLRPCPRDLKRTSVERHFRRFTFLVDWCSFRLVTSVTESGVSEEQEKANVKDPTGSNNNQPHSHNSESNNNGGEEAATNGKPNGVKVPSEPEVFTFRSEIPERGYGLEILLSTLIPGSIGGLVGFLLIALLWTDRDEDAPVCPGDEDALFFEAAFRMLLSMLRYKHGNGNGNGSEYIYHQPPQQDTGVVVMTRDNGQSLGRHPSDLMEERELMSTPQPPQYGETHPNGAPALIYAV